MPHTKDDAVLLTSGKSWQLPSLPNPGTQVRLLRFQPGSGNEDISVNIEVFDLDSAPAFNAISYTWGTEPPQHVIRIYDVSVFVRPNCHYALWQARQRFPGSRVWLDAICIDQSDLAEKASQVAIMGDVYAKADIVLACIGPADESSDGIRTALTNLDAVVQDLPDEWWDVMELQQWQPPQDEPTTWRLMAQFNDVCNRPYFSRVWIIQELFGGIDRIIILCGSYQLDWDRLTDLSSRLYKYCGALTGSPYSGSFEIRISRLRGLITLYDRLGFANPLGILLEDISGFECDDVRDRIFGTLRLVDWPRFGKVAPVPDYQISPLDLARDLMRFNERPPSLRFVRGLVHALKLEDQGPYLARIAASNVRTYLYFVHGAYVVQQDDEGCFRVALEAETDASNDIVPKRPYQTTENSEELDSVLAEHGLVPVFTDDGVSVLACNKLSIGDIIIDGPDFDLVLRPQDYGLRFTIVGQAIFVNNYGRRPRTPPLDHRPDCICWQDVPMNEYEIKPISLYIELSDEDAIAATAISEASQRGRIDMLTYLKHKSLGQLTEGSLVSDVTMSDVGSDCTIGPPKALCERHRAAEQYRTSGEALWYNIISNSGGEIFATNCANFSALLPADDQLRID